MWLRNKSSVDNFDKNIIEILESDGRASNAEIARSIGVSEGTIRRRLKKLIDNKELKCCFDIGDTDGLLASLN